MLPRSSCRASTQLVLAAVGVIQTIPSLALLAFLIPLLGSIGTGPALVALFLYALLPIVRNTHTGLAAFAGACARRRWRSACAAASAGAGRAAARHAARSWPASRHPR